MLNDSLPEEFKVLNNPALTGWNYTEDPQFPEGRQTALKLPLALANTTKSSTRVNLLS
jgi:hypothetical protein